MGRRLFTLGGLASTSLLALPAAARAAGVPPVPTVAEGMLTVALTGDMPMDGLKDGEMIGSDGRMITLIAQRLGLKPRPALMDWSSCIEAVRGGRADLTLGNMGWTAPRAEVLRLTDAVYYTGKFTLMRKDMAVGERLALEDMRGHSLGAVTGVTVVSELKKVPGITEVKLYDNVDACVRDVRAGRLDFAFLDAPTVGYMIAQNPGWDLKLVGTGPFPGFKVLGQKQVSVFGVNPANPDLFDAINAGVDWLWRSGGNARALSEVGMANPDFLIPVTTDPRLGVDRNEDKAVIGRFAHPPKDFSAAFAA